MSECSHNCQSCSEKNCGERKITPEKPHRLSSVKKVIGVVSGKGGVGKSLISSLTACAVNRKGYRAAILDADVTGPSIPKVFGLEEGASGSPEGLLPAMSKTGIQIMSVNLLLRDPTEPVVWRGPIIADTVKQFWTDVIWSDVDFMFVDMPPGTGDVPLTVFQSLPVDGIIVVSSPQDLVALIVEKALKMAKMMNIPVLGIVENMSYVLCPKCNEKIYVFGESKVKETAEKFNIPLLAQLPTDPEIAKLCDAGAIEDYDCPIMDEAVDGVIKALDI